MIEEVFPILPEHIRQLLNQLKSNVFGQIEEIRLRIGRPLEVIASGRPLYPEKQNKHYIVENEDAKYILGRLSQYSLYAFEEELKRGFITIQGGHRVGLAGKVVLHEGRVQTMRNISSFNIRIAREIVGTADQLISQLYDEGWLNTLFIGAPQSGKTTLLRDVARLISEGSRKWKIPPLKVGIVDERSEIAASMNGVPQLHLGDRVDVLDGCPKAEGMMMLIRSMSPDVIIVDEIGRKEDVYALEEALHAGVKVMTTAHGYCVEDVMKRPELKLLFERQAFDRYVELERISRPGVVRSVRGQVKRDVLI